MPRLKVTNSQMAMKTPRMCCVVALFCLVSADGDIGLCVCLVFSVAVLQATC
jgi:hypothetical protein